MRVLLCLLLVAGAAWATTVFPDEKSCPVCQEKVKVFSVMSHTSAGADRDFHPRTLGEDITAYYVAACPKCLYATYVEDFAKAVPPKLLEKLKSSPPRLPEGASDTKRGWVGADLANQVLVLQGATAEKRANMTLLAAWLVRVQDNPLEELFPEVGLKEERLNSLHEAAVGPSPEDLDPAELAERLLARLPEWTGERRVQAAVWAGSLLRGAGENPRLLERLPDLDGVLKDQPKWAEARAALLRSVERERGYQRQTVELLERCLAEEKPEEASALTYLTGELYRRLGNRAKALEWLGKAQSAKGVSEELAVWIREQTTSAEKLTLPGQPASTWRVAGSVGAVLLVILFLGRRRR